MLFLRGVMLPKIVNGSDPLDVVTIILRIKAPSGWFIGSKCIVIALALFGSIGFRSKLAVVQLHPPDTLRITIGVSVVFVALNVVVTMPPSSAILPKLWRVLSNVILLFCAVAGTWKNKHSTNIYIGKTLFTAQSYIFFNFFSKKFGGIKYLLYICTTKNAEHCAGS